MMCLTTGRIGETDRIRLSSPSVRESAELADNIRIVRSYLIDRSRIVPIDSGRGLSILGT